MNNVTMYLVNASLILLVIRQIREHPLDARSLAVPVLAVGCDAVMFLHSVPVGGSDLALEAACVTAGAVMGGLGGLATKLRLGADGRPLGRAGGVAEARSRARERGDRQRQALRPLGVVFLAVVVTASAQAHPGAALHGVGLAVTVLLVVYAAAVLAAVSVGWARRGPAAQAAVV